MTDLNTLTARRIELKAAQEEAGVKRKEAKKALGNARNVANRAVGQNLPGAAEAQEAVVVANNAYKDAEAHFTDISKAYQQAVQDESEAKKQAQKEEAINSALSGYDVVLTESNEYLGIFYDDTSNYVGFDIGVNGRAEGSFNVTNRAELENIITALNDIAQKMR